MGLVARTLEYLNTRRDRILSGKINSIPTPFPRFSNDFIGVEFAKYYGITTGTKVGKTTFSSFMFLYTPLLYAYYNPDKLRFKCFYYAREETDTNVLIRFMCYLLYRFEGSVNSTVDLTSSKNVAIPKNILDKMVQEPYASILAFFEKCVEFPEKASAKELYFDCQKYAREHGKVHKSRYKYINELGIEEDREKFEYYEPDDPDELKLIFYDHIGLAPVERGQDLRAAIAEHSKNFVMLRNRYGYTIAMIQQQNKDSDGLEAFKAQKLRPTINNLADNKYTSNDMDICLGLFSPFRYELPDYLGYDITKWRDNIRFLEVLINRCGGSNGIIALFYLGQCNFWTQMPTPKDFAGLAKVQDFLTKLSAKPESSGIAGVTMFIYSKLRKLWEKR